MNSMQLLQSVKYIQCEEHAVITRCYIHIAWGACNYYKVLNTCTVNSMQSLQGVKYKQFE